MGYHTDFHGQFIVTPTLKPEHAAYIKAFAETRRMARNAEKVSLPDPIREKAGLPLGDQAGYFVGGAGFMGQDDDGSVTNNNEPPVNQPSLWCQWVPTEDGNYIEWDGGEKFYDYVKWIEYLVTHFLKPWGYTLNGEVKWRGEEFGDDGAIIIKDNKVKTTA